MLSSTLSAERVPVKLLTACGGGGGNCECFLSCEKISRMKPITLLACILGLALAAHGQTTQDAPGKSKKLNNETLVISAELNIGLDELEFNGSPDLNIFTLQSDFSLGTLPAGKNVHLKLSATSDHEFSFDSHHESCRCESVKFSRKHFGEEPTQIDVRFKTPEGNSRGKGTVGISLFRGKFGFGGFTLGYDLENSLFLDSQGTYELKPGVGEVLVPVSFTQPVDPVELEASFMSGGEAKIPAEVVTRDGMWFVKIVVGRGEAGEIIAGDLVVFGKDLEISRKAAVQIVRKESVTLTPKLLYFSEMPGEDRKCFASALVRFADVIDARSVSADIKGVPLETVIQKLSPRIVRVKFLINSDALAALAKQTDRMSIQINAGSNQFSKLVIFKREEVP